MREQIGNLRNHEQNVECEPERDDRERFQHADAEEEKREDVRASLGLTSDRFDGFAGDDAVADRRTESNAGNDDAERQDGCGCNQCFRIQLRTFPMDEL